MGGEFWSEGELGDIENRAASSAAHIYGKNKVSAESFTAAGNIFGRYPAMFKERGDRFFAEEDTLSIRLKRAHWQQNSDRRGKCRRGLFVACVPGDIALSRR